MLSYEEVKCTIVITCIELLIFTTSSGHACLVFSVQLADYNGNKQQ